jgi:hypothetical protein
VVGGQAEGFVTFTQEQDSKTRLAPV